MSVPSTPAQGAMGPTAVEKAERRVDALRQEKDAPRHALRQEKDTLRHALRQEKDALRQEEDALRQEKDALRQKKDALRQKKDALRQEKDALRQEEDALRQEKDALRQKKDAPWQEEDALRQEEDALRQEEDALRQEKDALRQEKDALRQEKDALRQEKDALRQEQDALRQEQDALRQQRGVLQNEIKLLKKYCSRRITDSERSEVAKKLWDDFEINVQDVAGAKAELDNLNKNLTSVNRLYERAHSTYLGAMQKAAQVPQEKPYTVQNLTELLVRQTGSDAIYGSEKNKKEVFGRDEAKDLDALEAPVTAGTGRSDAVMHVFCGQNRLVDNRGDNLGDVEKKVQKAIADLNLDRAHGLYFTTHGRELETENRSGVWFTTESLEWWLSRMGMPLRTMKRKAEDTPADSPAAKKARCTTRTTASEDTHDTG